MAAFPGISKTALVASVSAGLGFGLCYALKPSPTGIRSERNPVFKPGEARSLTVVPANQDVATTLIQTVKRGTVTGNSKITSIIETLQPDEFAPMATELLECKAQMQQFAVGELYRVWALHDPKAAMASAATIQFPLKAAAEAGVVQGWTEQDPKAAKAWIDTLSDGTRKSRAVTSFLNTLAKVAPARLVEAIQVNPSFLTSANTYPTFSQLSAVEPKLAVEAAQKLPKGPTRRYALSISITGWYNHDPKAAREYLRTLSQSGGHVEEVRSALSNMAMNQSPEEAIALANELLPRQARASVMESVYVWWVMQEPQAARAWLNQLTDASLKRSLEQSEISSLIHNNPHEAIRKILEKPQLMAQNSHMFSRLAQSDPRAAVEAVMKLPEGRSRNNAIASLASGWAESEPEAAIQWLRQLPPGTARNEAFQRALYSQARQDPQRAIETASTELSAGWERTNLINNAVSNWFHTDPVAAEKWVNSLSDPELRNNAKGALISALAEQDPHEAIRQLKAEPELLRNANSLFSRIASTDPKLAAELALNFPATGSERQRIISSVVSSWTNLDPQAALAWIESLPPGGGTQRSDAAIPESGRHCCS